MIDEVLEGQIHVDELLGGLKIWCERCHGKGGKACKGMLIVDDRTYLEMCPKCKGKGYTELTDADLKELQNIAEKWTDPKTQEELYLGRCVKAVFDEDVNPLTYIMGYNLSIINVQELIEWGKQQGVE